MIIRSNYISLYEDRQVENKETGVFPPPSAVMLLSRKQARPRGNAEKIFQSACMEKKSVLYSTKAF